MTNTTIEIMAPAGSWTSLQAAIQGGANSVYFGIEQLNMRAKSSNNFILKDLKAQITEIWKKENLINPSIPLSIRIKFSYTKLQDLDQLKNIFYNISFVNNFSLEELDINNSFFKIDYYGNPKRLKTELLKFDYRLKNDQGYWEIYSDE